MRVGGRHYMPTWNNVESGRSAFLDGPRVGDLEGDHMYWCIGSFRGSAFGIEGGVVRSDHYLAGTPHRSGQTSRPYGWQSSSSCLSPETGGAMRGPQTVVHDLLRTPAHYRRRLQHYSFSRRLPKWAGWMRPRLGAAPDIISLVRPSGDGASRMAFHVEGPHLPIAPRLVPLFDLDIGALPIGWGDLPPAPLIQSHPSYVVLAGRDGEAPLFQTRPFVVARRHC